MAQPPSVSKFALAVLSTILIAGCAGGGGNGGGGGTPSINIPAGIRMIVDAGNGTVPLTVNASGLGSSPSFSWTLSDPVAACAPSLGSLTSPNSQSTTYMAPPAAQVTANCTVTVNVSASGKGKQVSTSVQLTVTPPLAVTISNPISTIMATASPVTINATVANDENSAGVSWTLTATNGVNCAGTTQSPAPCGTLSPNSTTSVEYAPPQNPPPNSAQINIVATSIASQQDTAPATATDTFTVTPAPITLAFSPNPPFTTVAAGGPSTTITVNMTHDFAAQGATFQVETGSPLAGCNTCGSLSGLVMSKSPNTVVTISYTPPASAAATISATIVATAVGGTQPAVSFSFTITPPPPPAVAISSTTEFSTITPTSNASVTATVTNDVNNQGLAWQLEAGSPLAPCSPTCGTLGTPTVETNASTTTSTVQYTAPSSIPAAPDNNPTLVATSIAKSSASASFSFTIVAAPISVVITSPEFTIIPQGANAVSITGQVTNDLNSQGIAWSLVQGNPPSPCAASVCGSLGTPAITTSGGTTTSAVEYTPPTGFQGVASDSVTLVAASVADSSKSASFTFTVGNLDSDCGYGTESLATGHYAALMRGSFGGGPVAGGAIFDLDGKGGVAANVGVEDSQGSVDFGLIAFDIQIDRARSFFSVGADQRGCLTLVTVKGTGSPATSGSFEHHFRFALGSVLSGIAHSGNIQEFDAGAEIVGTLERQDTSAFQNSSISGPYAFGGSEVGGEFGITGAFVADGSGGSSGGSADYNQNTSSNGNTVNGKIQPTFPAAGLSFSAFTMSVANNGRGTWSFTLGDGSAYNTVVYVISASKLLVLRTDQQVSSSSIPLFTAKIFKQSKSSFTTSDVSGTFVGYTSGISGLDSVGLETIQIQAFLAAANGSGSFSSFTLYKNDGGTLSTTGTVTNTGSYTVGSFGRVLISGFSKNSNSVEYIIGPGTATPSGGFIMDSNPQINFGNVDPQTSTSITSPTSLAFGTIEADSSLEELQTGVAAFNDGQITGTADESSFSVSKNVLSPDTPINRNYTIDVTGTGNIINPPATSCSFTGGTCQNLFIVISSSKIVMMDASSTEGPTLVLFEE